MARYADSDGYEEDRIRPHAWRWRHWVIEALNRNLPFDQFTIEQLAGDLLPDATLEQRVATGFHRNTLTNREGGVNREEFRTEQVIDRTATTGSVWLGLTLGCARCHDHKYDPISQKEFYQLAAFFNTAREVDLEAPLPAERGPFLQRQPEYEKKRATLLEEFKVAELQMEWEKKLRAAAAHPGVDLGSDYQLNLVQVKTDTGEETLMLPPEKADGETETDSDGPVHSQRRIQRTQHATQCAGGRVSGAHRGADDCRESASAQDPRPDSGQLSNTGN